MQNLSIHEIVLVSAGESVYFTETTRYFYDCDFENPMKYSLNIYDGVISKYKRAADYPILITSDQPEYNTLYSRFFR